MTEKELVTFFCPFLINIISNKITNLVGVNPEKIEENDLTSDELRTILQSTEIPKKQQKMLLNIFDMEYLSVNDLMVPRNEIFGIDINSEKEQIFNSLKSINSSYILFYKDSISNVVGFLEQSQKAYLLVEEKQSLKSLKNKLDEPLYILENTSLNKQLVNFQKEDKQVGIIVDEYGDVEGLITLQDIIEEIVGKITSEEMDILPQADGSFILEGSMMIREINKRIDWDLPTDGPKTLSGLILEAAQSIPENNVGISMGDYRFETVLIKDNVVKLARAEKLQSAEE